MTLRATWVMVGGLGLGAVHAAFAQTPPAASASTNAAAYANENGSDAAPLKLRDLQGSVRGLGGDAIPRASVSLFTEAGHSLIATVMSDRNGKFRFEKVDHGLYRVVARVDGLCTANIPIRYEGALIGHHKLEITMRPKDIDTCSYGMAK